MVSGRFNPSELDGRPLRRDGRRPGPPSAVAQDRLRQIKEAASRLFYERGYHGADLREIAAVVGLHPSTFYNYVGGKEQLLYLIIRDALDDLLDQFEQRVDPIDDPVMALSMALRIHTRVHAHGRYSAWSSQTHDQYLDGEFGEDIVERKRLYRDKWLAIIQRGIDRGVFRNIQPQMAYFGIIAMAHNVARWYREDGELSPDDIADTFITIALTGMIASPSGAEATGANGSSHTAHAESWTPLTPQGLRARARQRSPRARG
jgi:AcrR family transcriptional regulator